MPSVTVGTTIERAVEDVFAFLADNRNDPTWAPFVKYVEQVEGDGPGLGAAYEIGQVEGARVVRLRLTTTEYVEPSRLAWRMRTDDYRYDSQVDLEASGPGRTRLRQTNTIEFRIAPAGWAWFAMAQFVLRRQLRLLRTHLEG